jgi:hypothetical protein
VSSALSVPGNHTYFTIRSTVPPDMMLQWRSFSCRVRPPSVATPAVPNMMAIQQTQSMITTHLLALMNKGDRDFLSARVHQPLYRTWWRTWF